MPSELLNLALFALVILKASIITGISPMILIFSAAKMVAKAQRVSTRKPPGSWRVWVNPNPPSAGRRVA